MELREKGGLNGVKERRKVESRGVRGTEVESARKRRRTREGSRRGRGREDGGEGGMEEGGGERRRIFGRKKKQ